MTAATRTLPTHPDLDQLKRQAKELLAAFRSGDPDALAEVKARFHANPSDAFALHDAQLVLARSYGFQSWPKLKAYVDGVTVTALRKAVREGDVERVREMLRVRPELVNSNLSGYDDRPLHHAVVEHRAEMVRLLLEHGADPQAGHYPTPRVIAVERDYHDIAALIDAAERKRVAPAGRPITEAPALTQTLIDSLRIGDESQALAFFEAHPDLVRSCDPQNGMTPLHFAAAFLLEHLVAWLLDHGADVNARTRHSNTPLDLVGCGNGWPKTATPERVHAMMQLLLARGAKHTPRWAVASGNAEWLRARHGDGTLGNPIYGDEGLLSLAVKYDRPDILALLLDLGFDPDERRRLDIEPAEDSWGQPLRNCAEYGKLAMAAMLLARGADPNAHIYASGTPLFVAYGGGQIKSAKQKAAMIELLERHGGYLDAELVGWLGLADKAKELLTDEAAGRLRPDALPSWAKEEPIAELLLIGGVIHPQILELALPHIRRQRDDPWWGDKLSEACGRGEFACLELILKRCDVAACAPGILHDVADSRWPLSQGFRPEEERVIRAAMLLDAGARLDVRDDWYKSTPLGRACRAGRLELVKLFLARGADPGEADAEPWATPRAWARRMNHPDVLAVLDSTAK